MPSLILTIDQGTTNTKALLINQQGEPIFRTTRPVPLLIPASGHVEQSPESLWQSVLESIEDCTRHAQQQHATIAGIALTNQRETSVAWRRSTGQPLANAISWQCQRSAAIATHLTPHAETIRRITGLPLNPVLSATKFAWLLQNIPEVAQAAATNDLCLGTVDSWLLYKLTSGRIHATDHTNASRTALLDLETLTWSPELLTLFQIPASALPELRPSAANFGLATAIPALATTPIASAIGDSHAALAGHGNFLPGIVKATYGTGSSLMMLTTHLPDDTPQLARTIAWSTSPSPQNRHPERSAAESKDLRLSFQTTYALEGNIFMTGSALQWLGEFLNIPNLIALAEQAPGSANLHFIPAMAGLGAPHWDAAARGLISGLERTHTLAHLARAAVESIAFQVADVFFAMQDATKPSVPHSSQHYRDEWVSKNPISLLTDGGATRSDTLMQFQSDILGIPVHRSTNEELSAIGAAYLAGLTLNWWPDLEAIAQIPRHTHIFHPLLSAEARTHRYAAWQTALNRARTAEERP